MYLSVIRKPNVTTAVRSLAQNMECPADFVKSSVDHVFRYPKGTCDFRQTFESGAGHGLMVYRGTAIMVKKESKSATGCAIYYDSCLVKWESKMQS